MTREPRQPREYGFARRDDSTTWERGFTTREEAVAAGLEEYEGEPFVTGIISDYDANYFLPFDVADLLNEVADAADDELISEENVAGDWTMQLRAVAKESKYIPERNDLFRRLQTAFDEWAAAHNLTPEFFAIDSLTYHGSEQSWSEPSESVPAGTK